MNFGFAFGNEFAVIGNSLADQMNRAWGFGEDGSKRSEMRRFEFGPAIEGARVNDAVKI